MKHTIKTLFLSLFVVAMFSCAETTSEKPNIVEQASVDEWVKLNRPNAKKFKDGMYISTLKEAEAGAEGINDGSWILLNYVGSNLQGDIYANRYEDVARRIFDQGVFSPRTHYTPQLVRVVKDSSGVTPGQYEALKTMKVGQEVELIMPSSVAYGDFGSGNAMFGFTWGYNGTVVINPNKPAIIRMVAMMSVRSITAYENKNVYDYAKANYAGVESESDTIAPNFYAEIDYSGATMSDTIKTGSSFKYKYVARTLDGFIIDTNYPDTALIEWNQAIAGTLGSYSETSGEIQAFKTIVATDTLRFGCKFNMVFTSKYGYGYRGDTDGATVIQPYTPLIFSIEILPKEEDEDKEE